VAYDDGKDKLILARKAIFKTKTPAKDLLSKEQMASLEWSNEPAAVLVSDNFIMINIHLSSKEEKNKPQVDKMRRSLEELKTKLPRYNFIVAGDVNSFMGCDQEKKFPVFEQFFKFYPPQQCGPHHHQEEDHGSGAVPQGQPVNFIEQGQDYEHSADQERCHNLHKQEASQQGQSDSYRRAPFRPFPRNCRPHLPLITS
jgi:hypothetical protein